MYNSGQFYYRDTIKLTRCFANIQFWLCFLTQDVLLYSRIWWYLRTVSLLLSRFLGCPPLRERCVASQKKAAEETWELSSKLNILSRSFRPRGGDDSSVEKATALDVRLIFGRANYEGNAFSMKVNKLLQWNLDLTKSLGTGQICSLNGGFLISKTSI